MYGVIMFTREDLPDGQAWELCSIPEKILIAGVQLERLGESPFSAETLVRCAWLLFPTTFGLKGYEGKYPDSNKVFANLSDTSGPVKKRAWLARIRPKTYAVTKEGHALFTRLSAHDGAATPPATPTGIVSKAQDTLLQELFASTARKKVREKQKNDLSFVDACKFWGIEQGMDAEALDARIDHVRRQLAAIEKVVDQSAVVLADGHSISAEAIQELLETHDHLEGRFSRHLTLMRTRISIQK